MLEITYSKIGDYLIPNLVMDERSEGGIDAWKQRQENVLKKAQKGRLQSDAAKQNVEEALGQYEQASS